MCSNALNSRGKPAVSPMSGGAPTFDIEKNHRNEENLKLCHALRAGGLTSTFIFSLINAISQRSNEDTRKTL